MLIPSIDLMGGKIVQLVQGERKALEFDDFDSWIERFRSFPLVQLIDLDAAMGNGHNRELVRQFAEALPCQVGGGIRSIEAAEEILAAGAHRVIFGSSLLSNGRPDHAFAENAAHVLGADKLVFAIDSKGGRVAIRGWREVSDLTPLEMMSALDRWCGAFLYTHIDTEGLMQGIPLGIIRQLRGATHQQLIAAGGIATSAEIEELDALGVDAVVGMAIYTGKISLEATFFNHKGHEVTRRK